ncbi:MAG: Secretory immunoglobulin A-binding protein EsiB [Alphaproteobacteria bacterium MarineAlpha2_Bin1]|nr:MAG: Secretory immunoglobulin A-binding protein EsiB [Alphaproteobacteria bacterium MarineAlpha2_Bin1]
MERCILLRRKDIGEFMIKIFKNFFILLFLILFYNSVESQSLMDDELTLTIKEGTQARVKGDYRKALKILKPLAVKGNSEAQYQMGEMLRKGQGLPQNHKYALSYFVKSAKQKNVNAEYRLGSMYNEGWGVKYNQTKALYWWKKAAFHGHTDAQMQLSIAYFKGRGVERSFINSYAWSVLTTSQKIDGAKENKRMLEGLMTKNEIESAKKIARKLWKQAVEPYQQGSTVRRHQYKD